MPGRQLTEPLKPGTAIAALVLAPIVALVLSLTPASAEAQDASRMEMTQGSMSGKDPSEWRMPPMNTAMAMAAFLQGRVPDVTPFIPGAVSDDEQRGMPPEATVQEVSGSAAGDSLDQDAGLILRARGGRPLAL